MTNPTAPLDLDAVRAAFPALSGDWTFVDNAGGSQTLAAVADRIRDYLLTTDVQLGATYAVSRRAGERVDEGQRATATLVHASDPSEVVLGPSTSAMFRVLAHCLAPTLEPRHEIIVTNCDHEANISPWVELERLGVTVKTWNVDPETLTLETATLESLLSERTRLVAATHASNVLGTIHPVREWADRVHERGALLCIDGVAYAPHRRVDVQELDVDFYGLSLYKVYGPHQSVLYGKREHLLRLHPYNHFFIGDDEIPYKFQPGNVNYELAWGAGAILDYLVALGGPGEPTRSLAAAFDRIAERETAIGGRLLDYLASKPAVRVIGQPRMTATRVPTISFVVEGARSSDLPPAADGANIGIRWGDFYARRLIVDLGLERQDGVVRVSMVHYNTADEVDRLIGVLDRTLP